MSKRGPIAFLFWLLPLPIITLWTLWHLTQPNMDNAGYVLPAFAIASVGGVFLAALLAGALTGTTGGSLNVYAKNGHVISRETSYLD